jgi:predicted HAD superfamily Cof-like phosphohydrolase
MVEDEMIEWQKQVKEFMVKAGQETPDKPVIPSTGICFLRNNLILEELNEFREAYTSKDLVEVADAITDLLVVVFGAAVAFGINIKPCWDEVHRSNMSKFKDGYRREDGKWIKGPSYSPANLYPIIKGQLHV